MVHECEGAGAGGVSGCRRGRRRGVVVTVTQLANGSEVIAK